MKFDLSPHDIRIIVKALDHYDAYLRSQGREDQHYELLADRLSIRPEPSKSGRARSGEVRMSQLNAVERTEFARKGADARWHKPAPGSTQ